MPENSSTLIGNAPRFDPRTAVRGSVAGAPVAPDGSNTLSGHAGNGPRTPTMDKQHRFDKMARVTATYCDLIEHLDVSDCAACLRTMAILLPELHAAVAALPAVSAPPLLPDNPDIDARFELFSRLRQALGLRLLCI